MENINFDLTDFSDGLNMFNYREVTESFGTESFHNRNSNQHGGFFGFGCSDNDKKALMAARQKNYTVVCFMIKNDMIYDYGAQDDDGCTLLHYLVNDSDLYKENFNSIKKILSSSYTNNFINKQNSRGDTALISAVKFGKMDIADLLIKHGADKSIKNKKGFWIESDSCHSESSAYEDSKSEDNFNRGIRLSPIKTKMFVPTSKNVINDVLDNFFFTNKRIMKLDDDQFTLQDPLTDKIIISKTENESDSNDYDEYSDDNNYEENESEIIKDFLDKYDYSKNEGKDNKLNNEFIEIELFGGNRNVNPDMNTEDYINQILSPQNNNNKNKNFMKIFNRKQTGGDIYSQNFTDQFNNYENEDITEDTDQFLNNLINQSKSLKFSKSNNNNYQSGGVRKKKYISNNTRMGTRKLNIYDGAITSARNGHSELSRLTNNQATVIHTEVVKMIMDLMNVDEDTAKVYKAALWQMVKEKYPEQTTNLNKSVQMKELVKKDILKKIDVDKYSKLIEKHRIEKMDKQNKKQQNKGTNNEKKTNNKTTKPLDSSEEGIFSKKYEYDNEDDSDYGINTLSGTSSVNFETDEELSKTSFENDSNEDLNNDLNSDFSDDINDNLNDENNENDQLSDTSSMEFEINNELSRTSVDDNYNNNENDEDKDDTSDFENNMDGMLLSKTSIETMEEPYLDSSESFSF